MSHTSAAEVGATAEALLLKELQGFRARARLSFGRLAECTYYSRSSWERFLNGKRLPTREAVEQLARVVGEDPQRLLVLREQASAESRAQEPATESATTASVYAGCPSGIRSDPHGPGSRQDGAHVPRTWLPVIRIEVRCDPTCQAARGRIGHDMFGEVVVLRDTTGLRLQATLGVDHGARVTMSPLGPIADR